MITSDTVLRALLAKHSDSVCVPECKDGPTHTASHRRLDLWVMNKSWTHPRTIGYEIKVSKRDFVQDDKWQDYLPLCNELYFAAPKGLLTPAQMPGAVGLIELVGSRTVIRKKADHRQVQVPEKLYRYVLMCRTRICDASTEDPATYWREWLAKRKEDKELGYQVRRAVREQVVAAERAVKESERRMRDYDHIIAMLQRLGLSPDNVGYGYSVEQRICALERVVPERFEFTLNQAIRELEKLQQNLKQLREPK